MTIPRLERKRRPDFSLATINIVFLLLLFFLVAGSVVQNAEMGIKAPIAQKLPLENLPRPLLVMGPAGAMFLDGAPIARGDLVREAGAKLSTAGQFLNILAQRDLPARQLVDLLAALSAGGVPTRIVTLRDTADGDRT